MTGALGSECTSPFDEPSDLTFCFFDPMLSFLEPVLAMLSRRNPTQCTNLTRSTECKFKLLKRKGGDRRRVDGDVVLATELPLVCLLDL